jgi:hypothetical protein
MKNNHSSQVIEAFLSHIKQHIAELEATDEGKKYRAKMDAMARQELEECISVLNTSDLHALRTQIWIFMRDIKERDKNDKKRPAKKKQTS